MRIVVVFASLFIFAGVALAQNAPQAKPEQPGAAPAAYQPAVLNAPPAPEAPAPEAVAPAAQPPAAPSAGTRFPRYRDAAPVSAGEAERISHRAALLRDRRFTPQPAETTDDDQPIVHGDPRARWTLALSLDSLFYTDSGYDLFDGDNVSSRIGAWAGYDLAQLAPRIALAVELGFGAESREQGIWGGGLRTELESQTFSAGVSLRYALVSWLDPQLRASAGVTRFAFGLDTNAERFEDHALSGFGALGAGVLLHTPARLFENKRGHFASVSLGLLIEGGYALRSSIDVNLSRKAGDHAIPVTEAELGELALSGPYVRSSVLVRF